MEKLIFIPNEPKKKLNGIAIREEDIDMDFFDDIDADKLIADTVDRMSIRGYEEFKGKAIRLNNAFNYAVGIDSVGEAILIPLKK